MNFIGRMEAQEIQVDLKYCERCGGLWLRPQGNGGVYCASCRVCLEARVNPGPAPRGKARRRKARVQTATIGDNGEREEQNCSVRIGLLQGVAALEVWA
jgi:hypothetical protein